MIFDAGAPTEVIIGGRSYPINTDFRIGMKFEDMAVNSTNELNLLTKALEMYYPQIPPDIDAAVEELIRFYNCGHCEPAYGLAEKTASAPKQIYDYYYDAEYIYAAFREQYGINLCTAQLHWWEFRAMFLALSQDTALYRIMSYRNADLSELKGKAKRQMEALKAAYAIPLPPSAQEQLTDIKRKLRTTGIL